VEEQVPETRRHFLVRTALFEIIRDAFGDHVVVGSDQFVYWDPTDPRQCCAPDVFVRVGVPDASFDCWKVWERGAPNLAVEIVSASDDAEGPWETKIDRFRRIGVAEVVRFDPNDRARPVRIWDHVAGDLVERDPADPAFAWCDALGAYFCVRSDPDRGPTLRLSRDAQGTDIFPTPSEALKVEAGARKREQEARQLEADARLRAERRVADLEAELAKRGGA
jgi:hypothetical protein